MATYWENSCSFGLRYVSWYKYLIVSLVFSHLGFWSGNLFLIAPFPDLCLLVPFCPGFAEIARPLHKLCEKGRKFQWTSEAQEAFDKLKKLLTSPPVLAYPLPNIRFIVDTDSSAYSVGGVLSQIQNGHERVIAYMSKSMNQHEQNYCTTRKELLAVVIAFKTWHNYLYGQEILLRTDNMAVKWLRSLKAPTGQTFRWLQQLETYNFTTEYRAAKNHTTADALSRKSCKACERQEALN